MHLSLTLALSALSCLTTTANAASYTLSDSFDTTNFFSSFDFVSAADPTRGFVKYSDPSIANASSLAGYSTDQVYIGVDHTTKNPQGGRPSVRLESKKDFTKGLIIADITHMPKQVCGSWPALWTADTENWPGNGEIDIVEGVNLQKTNAITLHTGPGCSMSNKASPKTMMKKTNCNEGEGKTGCGQVTKDESAYGVDFNDLGGGVYATDWTSEYINVYFFPRNAIPADITSGNPDPSKWGEPTAAFAGECNIDENFKKHKIIINTTFCGEWAGAPSIWREECGKLAPTCDEWVGNNPEAFADVYWLFKSIKVYSQAPGTAPAKRPTFGRHFARHLKA